MASKSSSKPKNGRGSRRVTPGQVTTSKEGMMGRSSSCQDIVITGVNKASRMDKVVKFRKDQTEDIQIKRTREHKDQSQNTESHFEK